jgi:transcriptional regulator GlxA family with amidase domain
VLDVALSCGFKDGAHFSRVYRRTFGHPPRESRERAGAMASAVPARIPAVV